MRVQLFLARAAIVLLLLAYFLIRCHYLDVTPRWDAATYWGALATAVNQTLNPGSWTQLPRIIMEYYNAFGHPSMGYFGILALGQLFDFPNLTILNITNILLAMLSIYSVYKIFRWFLPERQYLPETLLATAAYSMDPLFFGCSIFLNTDFPVLVFFTTTIACLLYRHYGLFLLSSLFMIFSKEPGVMYWAAIVGGVFLCSGWNLLQSWRNGLRPRLSQLLPPFANDTRSVYASLYCLVCLLLPGACFKLFTIAQRGASWVASSGLTFDSNGWNCFGFNTRVMANRAGEIFVLNFHWVLLLLMVVATLIGIGRAIQVRTMLTYRFSSEPAATAQANLNKACHLRADRLWGILPIASSFLAFIAFNLTYITYIIPRYVVQGGFFLLLFTLLALVFATRSRNIRLSLLGLVLVLFSLQTFRTIDPLSKLTFGSAPFGEHKILQIDSAGEALGNGFVYNSEFTAVDKLFNLLHKAIPLTPELPLIMWNNDRWYSWFYVNSVTLERTVDWRNGFPQNNLDLAEVNSSNAPAKAVYVYLPWRSMVSNEDLELSHLSSIYQISAVEEVGFRGYHLRFYRLTRLPHVVD